MSGLKMLDQDEHHAALVGQRCEEGSKGVKPTSGGTDGAHREIGLRRWDCLFRQGSLALFRRSSTRNRRTTRHAGQILLVTARLAPVIRMAKVWAASLAVPRNLLAESRVCRTAPQSPGGN